MDNFQLPTPERSTNRVGGMQALDAFIKVLDIVVKIFDVAFKMAITTIATWWAIKSFGLQQEQTDKNIRAQLELQREMAHSQREMQEATLIASLLERLECPGDQGQRVHHQIAIGLVEASTRTFSALVSNSIGTCATTPQQREAVEKFRRESSLRELSSEFSDLLGNARQSRRFGLTDVNTLDEFEKAHSRMPRVYEKYFDLQEFGAARTARDEGKLAEALDHYEKAFRRIETNTGVNALPAQLLDGK